MKFVDVLERYHISPLKYEDNTVLDEKDYANLYDVLSKYFFMKRCFNSNVPKINLEEAEKKVDFLKKNSLIEITEEDILDLIVGVDNKLVVN